MSDAAPDTGATVLLDSLVALGARMGFGVPGESYLAALDAMVDRADCFRFITCRHEAAAANMAEAYGKLTGAPGLAFVTRGPGATHATTGLHTAFQDSTPMLLLIGQVARSMRGREAFQELDYEKFLSEVTKWTGEVACPDRMAEFASRAWSTALAGRQGPAALALPEDVLSAATSAQPLLPHAPVQAGPDPRAVETVADALGRARQPLILIGGGPWTADEAAALTGFAERRQIPVAASFRAQSLIDNESPAWAGHLGIGANPALIDRLKKSDLLLVIGPRLGEMTTDGYSRLTAPAPDQPMVHVHAGAEEPGRVYHAGRRIVCAPGAFAAALAAADPAGPDRADWLASARADELAWRAPVNNPGDVQLAALYPELRDALPNEAIIANGAGNYAAWLHRFFVYRGFRTQLAPTSGAMGYSVPAGIAASLVHPDRPAISVAGDGCFLMSGNELATAARHGARTVFLVFNNAMYGTIRMHQERAYPGRESGTGLTNPDFAAYARSFGLEAWTVDRTEDFAPALGAALASDGPALIEIAVDPRAISPTMRL